MNRTSTASQRTLNASKCARSLILSNNPKLVPTVMHPATLQQGPRKFFWGRNAKLSTQKRRAKQMKSQKICANA